MICIQRTLLRNAREGAWASLSLSAAWAIHKNRNPVWRHRTHTQPRCSTINIWGVAQVEKARVFWSERQIDGAAAFSRGRPGRHQVNRLESEILLWPEQITVRDEMNLYGFSAFAAPHSSARTYKKHQTLLIWIGALRHFPDRGRIYLLSLRGKYSSLVCFMCVRVSRL